MPSTIFTAPQYDPRRERRNRIIVAVAISAVIVVGVFAYLYRNWPEEQVVGRFFNALEHKNYEQAYGIWLHDPNWKAHPQQYPNYTYNDFYRDWGPGGDWGLIKSYHVDGSVTPRGGGTGVIVQVTVNDRAEKARLWVEKRNKTMTFCMAEGC